MKRFLKSPRPHSRQRNGSAARRKIFREPQHLLAPYPFAENSEISRKSSTRINVFGIREPAIGDHCRRRAVQASAGASSRMMDSQAETLMRHTRSKKRSRGRHGNYAGSKCAKVSQDIETTPKNRDENYNQYTEKAHGELSYLNWNVVGSGARTFSAEGEGLKSRFAEVLDELARNESQQHALTFGPYDRLNGLSL